jgi:hypothetical protein
MVFMLRSFYCFNKPLLEQYIVYVKYVVMLQRIFVILELES